METVSKAGHGLLKFINASVGYCEVHAQVLPKQEKVDQLQKEYNQAMKYLEKLYAEITQIEEELEKLNNRYNIALARRQELQEETEIMQRRLIAADTLISGLSSENERWKQDLANLHIEREKLVGNALLSGAFLSYTGPFTFEFRATMVYEDWLKDIEAREIPFSETYKIDTHLTNDLQIST